MLDEREVSWKILLPHKEEAQVLVFGLNTGAVTGLARTLGKISWNRPEGIKPEARNIPSESSNSITVVHEHEIKNNAYDIVIAGGSPPSLEKLSDLLVEDGTLVCLGFSGCAFNKLQLLSAGFNSVDIYGALPPNSPRVFYPMADTNIRNIGLGFHSPGSCKAKVGIQIAKILSNLGIKSPLEKGAVILAWRKKSIEGTLLEWLNGKLGQNIVDLVIYCGSDSERRKITALAIDKDNKKNIIKIADTIEGSEAIAQETAALLAISGSDLPATFPEIILEEKWNDYCVQIQTNVQKKCLKQVQQLTDTHLKLLSALTVLNRQRCKLATTQLWQETIDNLSKYRGELPRSISILADQISTSSYCEQEAITHRIHGDFTPWNINIGDGKITIWDWEDSKEDGLVFTDIFHFIVRQAILVAPWPGDQKIIELILMASGNLSDLAGISGQVNPLALFKFWLVREYLLKPGRQIVEIASGLTGDKHA